MCLKFRLSYLILGEIAWELLNHYGIPLEITQRICEKNAVKVDVEGFDKCLSQLKIIQKAENELWQKVNVQEMLMSGVQPTIDSSKYDYRRVGIEKYEFTSEVSRVAAIFDATGKRTKKLAAGKAGCVIMESTNFFAEQGGQLYDHVHGAKQRSGFIILIGEVADNTGIEEGMCLTQIINEKDRFSLMCGHTATHILHFALQKVFASPIRQMGSLIAPDKLHFDFSVANGTTGVMKVEEVTNVVNEIIESNLDVTVQYVRQNEVGPVLDSFSTFDISQVFVVSSIFDLRKFSERWDEVLHHSFRSLLVLV
ncbi:unnamed protein product [Gongylonema pulchrum]|uniref:AA_TRNA_LIGASE_II_ALA domain-containing protein n=1 Tax=Gongylonema pulchrum TaxID=637853 RepID=A0A183D1A1_9BILA|nr:unnamed protein product [Gongylonema pulchrum]